MSKFVPVTKAETKALVALCRSAEFNAHRANVMSTPDFVAATAELKLFHAELFAHDNEAVRSHRDATTCLWESSGLNAMVADVAERFAVPVWDVRSCANSLMN